MFTKRIPLAERFERFVMPEPNSGCWLWTGNTCKGYGRIGAGGADGRLEFAHRVSWELHKGPIPEGLRVLHRCDVPGCVNPEHLFLGTQIENMKDAVAKGRWPNSSKTHCPRGHPYEGANLRLYRGRRHCRACANTRKG